MNTQINSAYNSSHFIVNKKQVNKKKTLKTSVLYNKIESNVNSALHLFKDSPNLTFKSIDFDIIENAYLNDKLVIKNSIKKYSSTELVLDIIVSKKTDKKQDIICKASFGYNLKKAS